MDQPNTPSTGSSAEGMAPGLDNTPGLGNTGQRSQCGQRQKLDRPDERWLFGCPRRLKRRRQRRPLGYRYSYLVGQRHAPQWGRQHW